MYCVVVRHKGVFLPQDVSSNTVMQLRTFEQYTCWDCEGGGVRRVRPPLNPPLTLAPWIKSRKKYLSHKIK